MAKITKEKFKTYEGVFDQFTNKNIFKLISQGHFEGISSPISIGKEANVFSAITKNKKAPIKVKCIFTDFGTTRSFSLRPNKTTYNARTNKSVTIVAPRNHPLIKLINGNSQHRQLTTSDYLHYIN